MNRAIKTNKLRKESTDLRVYYSIIDISLKIELLADSISLSEGPF